MWWKIQHFIKLQTQRILGCRFNTNFRQIVQLNLEIESFFSFLFLLKDVVSSFSFQYKKEKKKWWAVNRWTRLASCKCCTQLLGQEERNAYHWLVLFVSILFHLFFSQSTKGTKVNITVTRWGFEAKKEQTNSHGKSGATSHLTTGKSIEKSP